MKIQIKYQQNIFCKKKICIKKKKKINFKSIFTNNYTLHLHAEKFNSPHPQIDKINEILNSNLHLKYEQT